VFAVGERKHVGRHDTSQMTGGLDRTRVLDQRNG
jgi:hypothetical protein